MSEFSIRGVVHCAAFKPIVKNIPDYRCEYQLRGDSQQINIAVSDKTNGAPVTTYKVTASSEQDTKQNLLRSVDNVLIESLEVKAKNNYRNLIKAHNQLKEWCPNCLP